MDPYSIVPTFLDSDYKNVVLERLSELLAGVEPNYYSDKWRDGWQKAFGCKCYLKNQRPFFKLEYEHVKISFVAHALTSGHYKLERKLTELLEFLFQGYHPYFLLGIEMEDDVQMMKPFLFRIPLKLAFILIIVCEASFVDLFGVVLIEVNFFNPVSF